MKVLSPKTDKLAKSIHAVRQFVSERSAQDNAYLSINSALASLEKALETKNLIVQIVSQDATQAQSLQKLLGMSALIRESYLIQTSLLPQRSQRRALPATLTLRCDRPNGKQPFRYELTTPKPQMIGRNPDAAQILLPDELNLVGGCHLEIQPFMTDGWQVRDIGSRNGTYINGDAQKLQGWYQLKTGDQIHLGSAFGTAGRATLVFESASDQATANDDISQLFNCDVLCLITDLSQPLPKAAKQFIAQASEGQIAKLFIIATTPGIGDPETIQAHWRTMDTWVRNQPYYALIEQIALALQPVIASPQATVLFPQARPEFEQFCQTLETLVKNKAEEMLIQRITAQLLKQVRAIELLLNNQAVKLQQEIKQAEEDLNILSLSNLKEQMKKAIKKAEGEKDRFKQIKNEVAQSKSGFLYERSQNSLPYKIEHFVKQLKPTVKDQYGYRTVVLDFEQQSNNAFQDVHTAILNLAQTELDHWANSEWRQVCMKYAEGGLINLSQRSYGVLNSIPKVELPSSSFQMAQSIDVSSVLQISDLALPECQIRYKQMGILGYLLKDVKGRLISIVSTLMLIAGAVTVFSGNWSPSAGNNKSFIKPYQNVLVAALLPIVCTAAALAYRQEKAIKLEESVEKLQKETLSHYQTLSRDLAEKLLQHLSSTVDNEERRFWLTLEAVSEQYAQYGDEIEKLQFQLKIQVENGKKVHLKTLEQSVADLQKLKREIPAIAPTMTKL